MSTLSVVIPALNERSNMEHVIASIPVRELAGLGWETEILVVDNGSTDGTGEVAKRAGARVLVQPVRGYGNAYKAGFANAVGDVIATGDADRTYPFEILPGLLRVLQKERLDFLTTNRLQSAEAGAMKPSHRFGNAVLTQSSRLILKAPFSDSQSGMWMFYSRILRSLDLRSPGMAFSQEIKHEAVARGFRCGEVPIKYRARGGDVKLNATRDGLRNLGQLAMHRMRRDRPVTPPAVIDLRHYESHKHGAFIVHQGGGAGVAERMGESREDPALPIIASQ
jgi:glycosyltransferase involved in cell wall biosynthesis